MLTASDWRSVGLLSLMSEEIIPFAGRIEVDGPDIALRARSAQTFALLFYELATNAAKHGALSVPGGKVNLRWHIDNLGSDPVFHLLWKESGGPQVGSAAAARLRRIAGAADRAARCGRQEPGPLRRRRVSNTSWKRRCGN